MVLPDINLSSKEVQTSHLGVIKNQQLPEQGQAVRPGNWNRLCFWCRDYAPADQANHLIKNCPYYNQGRKDWWTQQGVTSVNADPASVGHTSRQGPN